MMRDSSGGDPAVSVIPITRSLIFWESSEVCRWLEALQFDGQVTERCVPTAPTQPNMGRAQSIVCVGQGR